MPLNLAMQTPFDASGAVDLEVFEELVDKYAEAGRPRPRVWIGHRPASLPHGTGVQQPLRNRSQAGRWLPCHLPDFGAERRLGDSAVPASPGVLNGCDTTTLYALMAGCRGVIWGGANYMPREAVELYDLATAQRWEEAQALWPTMLPSLLFIWRTHYSPSVLRAAQLRGFGTGNVRKPLSKLTAEQDQALQRSLAPLLA